MAANGPRVNHEGEVINITGPGPNGVDVDDDDARSISPMTIGTEWNPRPIPRRHHHHHHHHHGTDGGSAKILGEDSYGMNLALGVNVEVSDKSSRKKSGKSRDRLTTAVRVGKDAVAAGAGQDTPRQGRRKFSGAHPLWGSSGAIGGVKAVTGRRSSVDRSSAIDAKMAARETARQEKAVGRSAAEIAEASAAISHDRGKKDRDASELLSMSPTNNDSGSTFETFGDTAANGFVSVHKRNSDEPYVPKEREDETKHHKQRDIGSMRRTPSDKIKSQANNSISVLGFADMFNIQGKQSSGSTGRSGSWRTGDGNDDSCSLFGDAGTFADVKPLPPEAPVRPAPVKPAHKEAKRGSITAPKATASASEAPAEMLHTGNASRSSFTIFAGDESRGSLSMAMEALGLDQGNSGQTRANQINQCGIPDEEGRRAAIRPGAVYEHTPAPEAYHYQNAQSRGISSGRNNPRSRSRADVLRDMEQQEQERLAQLNLHADNPDGRIRTLSKDIDLEAVLRLSDEGGASHSDAARFLEEQRAAMERFEANQRAPTSNSTSLRGNNDYNIASNEYSSSTDGINTGMTTVGGGPNRPLIEISPGRFEFLRGSEETWNAIKRGNFASVICEACQADLRCVADADMVVCPDCRCVCALDGRAMPSDAGGFSEGGVGLGVLVRDLAPTVQRRLGVNI